MKRALLVLAITASRNWGASSGADSTRGAQLFETLSCVQCHAVNGKGGDIGPDLGQRLDRNFTPASLAATMWNHAPTMWTSMQQRNIPVGNLDEQAAADLFAYFYASRFFEKPGDAGRGKRLFSAKHCADCHGLTDRKLPAAKPVTEWKSIGQPIELADAMWNHGATMRLEFAQRKLPWPELSSQDLSDILVYLRNLPAKRNGPVTLVIASGANGQALFASKGCAGCHTGKLELTSRLQDLTLTDIAVAMWNHQPKMAANPAPLSSDEMHELLSYLWAGQFFKAAGNPGAGQRVFASKHCASCHNDASSGAPKLAGPGRSFTAASMVSALWHHGPRMLGEMKNKSIAWPRFEGRDMANLIAYLNSQNGGK